MLGIVARFPFAYIIILWEYENRKVLEMLKALFNIVILAVALYVSYRLIKSGSNDLKKAKKIRQKAKKTRGQRNHG